MVISTRRLVRRTARFQKAGRDHQRKQARKQKAERDIHANVDHRNLRS